jgi:hypothetical protein
MCVEPASLDLGRDPVRKRHEVIERQSETFAPHDFTKRHGLRSDVNAVTVEPPARVHVDRDDLIRLVARQEHARLLEQLAYGGDVKCNCFRRFALRQSCDRSPDTIAPCVSVGRVVARIDAASRKYMRSAHERDAVVALDEEDFEPRIRLAPQHDGGRRPRRDDAHRDERNPLARFLLDHVEGGVMMSRAGILGAWFVCLGVTYGCDQPRAIAETGCLTADGDQFVLTALDTAEGGSAETETYLLEGEEDELRSLVGRAVHITGRARVPEIAEVREVSSASPVATSGSGAKVETESQTRIETSKLFVASVAPAEGNCSAATAR